MGVWKLIWKGVAHYWGLYLGVVAGVALAAMVLLGALMAGDSVNGSLERAAVLQTGQVERVLVGGDRFFREELTQGKQAPVLALEGQVNAGERGQGQVQVLGVDERFFDLGPEAVTVSLSGREVGLSEALANSLGLKVGDEVVIRLPKPGLLSRDAPLSGEAESMVVMRGVVRKIVRAEEFGRFSLRGSQVPPYSVFVPLLRLQEAVERPGRVNLLLLAEGEKLAPLTLADYGMSLVDAPGGLELRSDQIFFANHLMDLVSDLKPKRHLTYLINTLRSELGETPYSMATAVERADFLPELAPGEIVINDWLAEDLQVQVAEQVELTYFVLGADNELREEKSNFRVRAIVPLQGLAADRRWMPDFPGVAEVESARDWKPGLPLDLKRIRDKDDDYWEKHRGTPKVWLPYMEGVKLWENRWGQATGLRFDRRDVEKLTEELEERFSPELTGLVMRNFRDQALGGAKSPVDFASLFLSMGFFLVIASLALVAMLCRFNTEQRSEEDGLLNALGIADGRIRRWRLGEILVAVAVGGIVGTGLAVGFCLTVLRVIGSIWESGFLGFYPQLGTLVGGWVAVVVLALVVVWWSQRRLAKRAASIRLQGVSDDGQGSSSWLRWIWLAVGGLLLSAGVIAGPPVGFFCAGLGVLILGLGIFSEKVRSFDEMKKLNPDRLGLVNLARRRSRGFTVALILAIGVFLVVSVSSFRKDGGKSWRERESGAGGFGLWVETTTPVNRPADVLGEVAWFDQQSGVVPVRIGEGDNVDCFNLTSSARPLLLGVDPQQLYGRFGSTDWGILAGEGMPALVDETTLLWVLRKRVGDTLTYTDESGEAFEVTIAGTLKDSIFQGHVLVAEDRLLERYPALGGYRLFLVENPELSEFFQRETADLGGEVRTTQERLAAFHEVENTYIGIFNLLGGLGMILASVGVGVVTLRNLAERREEFQLLKMLGWPLPKRRAVARAEVATLLRWGLGIGAAASMISVAPLLGKTMTVVDLAWVGLLFFIMAGVAWMSARWSIRKSQL